MRKLNPWVGSLILMVVLILIIPISLPLIFSCLRNSTTESYLMHQCLVGNILDKMILLELSVISVFGVLTFVRQPKNKIKYAIINLVLGGTLFVGVFYLSLPEVMRRVEKAPIIVSEESFLEEKL